VEFPDFVSDRKTRKPFKTGHRLFFRLLLALVIVRLAGQMDEKEIKRRNRK
jgi:hypothetical protein